MSFVVKNFLNLFKPRVFSGLVVTGANLDFFFCHMIARISPTLFLADKADYLNVLFKTLNIVKIGEPTN